MADSKKTASGEPVTDELVEVLARKAEAGYDVEETLRRRHTLESVGDTMQSSLSRLIEYAENATAALMHTPYEARMAMHEGRDAIDNWTELRARATIDERP